MQLQLSADPNTNLVTDCTVLVSSYTRESLLHDNSKAVSICLAFSISCGEEEEEIMPPYGFKRSRALWDDARSRRQRKVDEWKSLFRAILYELQPIRFSEYNLTPSAVGQFLSTQVVPTIRNAWSFLATVLLPKMVFTIRSMNPQHWMIVGAVVIYYCLVRWIHEYVVVIFMFVVAGPVCYYFCRGGFFLYTSISFSQHAMSLVSFLFDFDLRITNN